MLYICLTLKPKEMKQLNPIFENNNSFAEREKFDKGKRYVEPLSKIDVYGDTTFRYWYWGRSVNSNFIMVWMGQAYHTNLENFIKNHKNLELLELKNLYNKKLGFISNQ